MARKSPAKKVQTLCLVLREGRILLGMKKRGFGEGRWNGFGGKVEKEEKIEDAARRELREEAGIEAGDLVKAGILEFEFDGDPAALEVHVFAVYAFAGEPRESGEMKPRWFDVGEIPFGAMWPDDRHWLPLLLGGKNFSGRFSFDGQGEISAFSLEELAPGIL